MWQKGMFQAKESMWASKGGLWGRCQGMVIVVLLEHSGRRVIAQEKLKDCVELRLRHIMGRNEMF